MDNMNAVNLDTTRRMHVLWNAPLIIITNEEFHIYKIPEATEQGLCAIHELTLNGPLARYAKLRVRMRRECRERFPRHHR